MNSKTSRRNFLKSTSLISTSLIVGFKFNSPNLVIAKETSELDPNLYVIISPNNNITFISMGIINTSLSIVHSRNDNYFYQYQNKYNKVVEFFY